MNRAPSAFAARAAALAGCISLAAAPAFAADWPQWGGRNERNFASGEIGLPAEFGPESRTNAAGQTIVTPAKNIKWTARLGTQTWSSPSVAAGRVFIGSNDAHVDDARFQEGGGGVLLCFDDLTGARLWQLVIPRLKTRNPKFNFDDMGLGLCSTPVVEGKRAYVVSSRGEVLCVDTLGQADGNDGPYTDEGAYMARTGTLPDKPGLFDPSTAPPAPTPVPLNASDADIVWVYDYFTKLGVWSQDCTDCSVLIVGDYVVACTSVGVDKSHSYIPSPDAPDLIVLEKATGRLVAVNAPPIGKAIFHGEWSSPSLAQVGGQSQILWGGGDGVCYAFDARIVPGEGGRTGTLERVWSFDCNPSANRYRDGKPLPYNKNQEGPSEIIATPVVCGGRVFVDVGQDSRHGPGPGCLSCFNPAGVGDITQSGLVWRSQAVGRSFSSAAVTNGLAFVADYAGVARCFDAASGQELWSHDLKARVFSSPFAADGKVYVGDDKGHVTVFACARDKRVLAVNKMDSAVYATPVAANGVLYIASQKVLYAFQAP